MRIAMVVHQLPPEHLGGVEVYTWTLARRLAALGQEVALFAPTDDRRQVGNSTREGIHVVRVYRPDPRGQRALGAFWHSFRHRPSERAFARFLADWAPDLVHFQHLQWVSARLPELCRKQATVLTLHDYWFACPNSQLVRADGSLCAAGSWRGCAECLLRGRGVSAMIARRAGPMLAPLLRYRNRQVRRAALRADLLLTPSDQARELYERLGFAPGRIQTFANGLDRSRLGATQETHPRRDHLVVGYLGGLAWQKGPHVLVEAFNSLPPEHELRVYGPAGAVSAYAARLRELARHPGTRLMGSVPLDQVGPVLGDLDYLVVPSLWPETFGMVAQEANYLGVPVIASNIGALQRVRDGVDGRLFEPGDVQGLSAILQELADDPAQRARLAANLDAGPTLKAQAERLLDLYRELLASRQTGQA